MKYDFDSVNLPKLSDDKNKIYAQCNDYGGIRICRGAGSLSPAKDLEMAKIQAEALARFMATVYLDKGHQLPPTTNPAPERTFSVIMTVIITSLCGGVAVGLAIVYFLQ